MKAGKKNFFFKNPFQALSSEVRNTKIQSLETSQLFSLHYCIPFFLPDVLQSVAMQPSYKPQPLIILLLIAIERKSFSV